MARFAFNFIAALILVLTATANADSQPPKFECSRDEIGASGEAPLSVKICFGLGEHSWASRVVSFREGSPVPCGARDQAIEVLGKRDNRYAWLGNGGNLSLEFKPDILGDHAGPDLWIFEGGQNKEAVRAELRTRADTDWILFGETTGGRTAIDLAKNPKTSERTFSQVRLTDLSGNEPPSDCVPREKWDRPGADIDAVGASICAIQFDPGQLALFAVDEFILSDSAKRRLHPVVELLQATTSVNVRVLGFADADGSEEYNRALSGRRANSVRQYLEAALASTGPAHLTINTDAYGEVGSESDTADWKARNRRVEIEVSPAGPNACLDAIGN